MRENRTYGLTRGSGETHNRGEPDSTLQRCMDASSSLQEYMRKHGQSRYIPEQV